MDIPTVDLRPMDLTRLRAVFEHEGPTVTVYLERRPPAEDSAQQSRLRWQAVRDQLHEDGAPDTVLDVVEAALAPEQPGEIQADGRVLVAAEDGLLLDEPWDASLGSGDTGFWADAPRLEAHVREYLLATRLLVAITDQERALIRHEVVAEHQNLAEVTSDSATGTSIAEVHKSRGGDLSHKQSQRRADEAAHRNARDIIDNLERHAQRFHPDVLVLAGHVQGRTAVREDLGESLSQICVEAERGGVQDNAAEDALAEQLDEIAQAARRRRIDAATSEFAQAKSKGLSAEGPTDVIEAARMGAVSTVVLPDADRSTGLSEVFSAASASGAQAMLAELDEDVTVAAVLRFSVPTS